MNDICEMPVDNGSYQAYNIQKPEKLDALVINNYENTIALHSLAMVAHQMGQNNVAINLIEEAIESDPQNPQFYNTYGLVLEAIGKINEAIHSYEKAILINPAYAQAYLNLTIALQSSGDFEAAVEKCNQIISLFGGSAHVYNLMGYSLEQQGCFREAIESYRQAIRLKPDFAEPYNHMGVIFIEQSQYYQAVINCQKALELAPDYVEAYNNLGVALNGIGQYVEAMEIYKKAICLDSQYIDAYYNWGNCLRNQNQCELAIPIFKKAIQISPDCAKAHWNLAISYLLAGKFPQGWAEYQYRRNPHLRIITSPHQYEQPYWDGSSFKGKRLLVHYEQGFGDNIQFVRYLPMVKQLGGTVILEVEKPLYGLFKQIKAADEFVLPSSGSMSPDVTFDFHISILDLPRIFATTIEDIPSEVPYLSAEPAKTKYWKGKLDSKSFKVGLVWAGSPRHQNDHNRSCPPNYFVPLAKIKGIKLYNLQKDPPSNKKTELVKDISIEYIGREFEDFTDTAAAIENMDLVISVDTSVLHLAGAMGKPVWAIIPFVPDWRWMLDRQDSPWYPTMRLFRQKEPGNWDELLTRLAEQLQILVQLSGLNATTAKNKSIY